MEKTIRLPAKKSNAVSELAIFILSKKWPLSFVEIHNAITKDYKKDVSPQATHKSLQKLVEQNVLSKKDRQYSLNQKWVGKLADFSAKTKKAYSKQGSNQPFG